MKTLLLFDYDNQDCERIFNILSDKLDYHVEKVNSVVEVIDYLSSKGNISPDALLLGLDWKEKGVLDIVRTISRLSNELPILALIKKRQLSKAMQLIQVGISDFITKPCSFERIQVSLSNSIRVHDMYNEILKMKSDLRPSQIDFSEIVAESGSMKHVVTLARKAAMSNIRVLIEGESGVGKKLLANVIHDGSNRMDLGFNILECENSDSLPYFDSSDSMKEFFRSNKGTIYIDGVDKLSQRSQSILLRLLRGMVPNNKGDEKFTPDIGNPRIICSSTRDLNDMVKRGLFYRELLYYLNVYPIYILSLNQRTEDILILLDRFIKKYSISERKRISSVTDEAKKFLLSYDWPHNIREFENAVFRSVVLCDDGVIDIHHFQQLLNNVSDMDSYKSNKLSIKNFVGLVNEQGHVNKLSEIEREIIDFTIDFYGGRMSESARRLGIGRSTLYRKIGNDDASDDSLSDGENVESSKSNGKENTQSDTDKII